MKVCILGFGGIARVHTAGYLATMAENKGQTLVGICDINPAQFDALMTINTGSKGALDLSNVRKYTDWEEMLEKEQPDLVDICLPTYLHKEYTIKVLEKGFNVQCEKPMALNSAQCEEMLAAAEKAGKKLFIGQVVRFMPAYQELKKMVEDGRFGKARSALFTRLSFLPVWGFENWFPDVKRSGGVALDLHIHDVDFIRYLFGDPEAVSASVVSAPECACISVHTLFHYNNMAITAIGEFGRAQTTPFRAGFDVNFEKATVSLDENGLKVYPAEGEPYVVDVPTVEHMQVQSLFFASVINGAENTVVTAAEAAKSVALVEKIVASAANGGRKEVL